MSKIELYTYSGDGLLAPFAPLPAQLCIEDVARGLAYKGRWSGQTRKFYSVAQHSIMVSDQCSEPYQLWGLLHDAGEAFLGDMPAPMKPYVWFHVPDAQGVIEKVPYFEAERRILHQVLALSGASVVEMPEEVHVADMVIRDWEYSQFVCRETRAAGTFPAMGPDEAMTAWLRHYYRIRARDMAIDNGQSTVDNEEAIKKVV